MPTECSPDFFGFEPVEGRAVVAAIDAAIRNMVRFPEARSAHNSVGQSPAMQQIADWLEKLGMSEYEQRFAENGITVAALRHLTDQDLKDIGVLLAAIAGLNDMPAVAAPSPGSKPILPRKSMQRIPRTSSSDVPDCR
jgi:uncharacterized protein YjiS (DUF1127 family)